VISGRFFQTTGLKALVILPRIDPTWGTFDQSYGNPTTCLQESELLQFLDLLEWTHWELVQGQQKIASVRVNSKVLDKIRWLLEQQRFVPSSRVWHHRSTEVERRPIMPANYFDARWILDIPPIADGGPESRDVSLWVRLEQLHDRIDRFTRNLWFVSLHVDKDVDIVSLASNLRNSVSSALRIDIRHLSSTAKGQNRVEQA
jgi:hypothetical protein